MLRAEGSTPSSRGRFSEGAGANEAGRGAAAYGAIGELAHKNSWSTYIQTTYNQKTSGQSQELFLSNRDIVADPWLGVLGRLKEIVFVILVVSVELLLIFRQSLTFPELNRTHNN
jgi:hypothetical protein